VRPVRVAVVTGAGRGLGREIARRLAALGYAVLVTDVDAAAADRTAADMGGVAAWAARLDVRDPEACRAVAREAASVGPLAVWVNNAGVSFAAPAWEHSDEDVALAIAVNLGGVVNGTRAALGVMGDGARLLNVASLSALGPVPGLALYGATKHAVLAFGDALVGDLSAAGRDIEVRTLCPDVIDTQMVRAQVDSPEAAILWSGGRLLSADEVADRAIELLEGRRHRAIVPAWRGTLLRAFDLSPALAARGVPLFRRLGERNRRRWRERVGI
jgi:NAD(P)-dependent dehydrogenase (short-subunit alcohol dehydrogenase family)